MNMGSPFIRSLSDRLWGLSCGSITEVFTSFVDLFRIVYRRGRRQRWTENQFQLLWKGKNDFRARAHEVFSEHQLSGMGTLNISLLESIISNIFRYSEGYNTCMQFCIRVPKNKFKKSQNTISIRLSSAMSEKLQKRENCAYKMSTMKRNGINIRQGGQYSPKIKSIIQGGHALLKEVYGSLLKLETSRMSLPRDRKCKLFKVSTFPAAYLKLLGTLLVSMGEEPL